MRISMLRFAVGGLALLSTVSTSQCAKPEQAAEAATLATELTPLVSVKELMENIIDPQADFIFDAVAVDIGEHGVVETKPTSEDDWLKVQRATVLLAERYESPQDASPGRSGRRQERIERTWATRARA